MVTTYLVPCDCGKTLEVEPSQAGLSVTCDCGAATELPTLGGLRSFPTKEQQKASRGSAWGPRQGLLTAGLLMVAVSAVLMLAFYIGRPREPELIPADREGMRAQAQGMTLVQSLKEWQKYPKELSGDVHPMWAQTELAQRNYRLWMGSVAAVGVVGFVLVGVSRLVRSPGARQRR